MTSMTTTTTMSTSMTTTELRPQRLGDHEHRADAEHDHKYNDHGEHKPLTPITTTAVTRKRLLLNPTMNDICWLRLTDFDSEQTTTDQNISRPSFATELTDPTSQVKVYLQHFRCVGSDYASALDYFV